MATGIGLPTPKGFAGGAIVAGDIVLTVPIAADQWGVVYNAAVGDDLVGGGTSPDFQLEDESGVVYMADTTLAASTVLGNIDTPICLPMGQDVILRALQGTAAFTAGSLLATVGIGGLVGTGTGLPTPKPFSNAVANGADWEVVITPGADEHVVIYNAVAGDDMLGTTTSFQLISGGVVYLSETLSAPGTPDLLTTLDTPIAFPKGQAVTTRLTATTAGTLVVTAGIAA